MQELNENQIIQKLKQMKQIKPRQNWSDLTLSRILSGMETQGILVNKVGFTDVVHNVFNMLFQNKLAYSLALFAFVIVGVLSFAGATVPGDALFPVKKLAEESQATLSGRTGLSQNITTINNRIKDLEKVAKEGRAESIPATINEIKTEVLAMTNSLKAAPLDALKEGEVREIADTLKVLAGITGADLTGDESVQDLYKLVVQNQMSDLEKSTLTEEQAEALSEIKVLYEDGKYAEALEAILLK